MNKAVFVHVVTYNSSRNVLRCMQSVLTQRNFEPNKNLWLHCTDNASQNSVVDEISREFSSQVSITRNRQNMGFCAAHNQGVFRFLKSEADYLLILNPDTKLCEDSLLLMIEAIESDPSVGMATPLLLRCDAELNPLSPELIDAAGMMMSHALRHLDRGSGAVMQQRYKDGGYVFGGTGACLLISRSCVQDLIQAAPALDDKSNQALWSIYPCLREGISERSALFDEAFFAYREDAELAWRAQLLGWRTRYVPEARVYHERRVVPERRAQLPATINAWGVRNRFLMQANNLTVDVLSKVWLQGVVFRNIVVILGVIFREWSSLPALWQVIKLLPRALQRRRVLLKHAKERRLKDPIDIWFGSIDFLPIGVTCRVP